jgi:hypothetical protein
MSILELPVERAEFQGAVSPGILLDRKANLENTPPAAPKCSEALSKPTGASEQIYNWDGHG